MIRRISSFLQSCVLASCALLLVLIGGCTPTPTEPPTPDPSTWPTWTFMVFLNGDNSLDGAAVNDFEEMAEVGSNDRLNIVVQLDRLGKKDKTKRYLIGLGDTVDSTPVQTLDEQNMGDPQVLEDFIEWALANYEADHYILVIWNHGDGWRLEQQKIAERETTLRAEGAVTSLGMKGISQDETDGNDVLYMHEVGQALEGAYDDTNQTLDIVGFDACLMGMIEVAYEIRDYADFMVGSEETEPADGWPYDTVLNDLVTLYEARMPRNLAKIIVQRYGEFYGTHGDETQAAYDLDIIQKVTASISDFVQTHNALRENDKDWPKIGEARTEIEGFHDNCRSTPKQCWGVDIGDFAVEVGERVENDDVQEVLLGLLLFVGEFVIENYYGDDHPDAFGVAIYFPPDHRTFLGDPQHNGYEDTNTDFPVAFVQDLQWDNWLREQYFAQFP